MKHTASSFSDLFGSAARERPEYPMRPDPSFLELIAPHAKEEFLGQFFARRALYIPGRAERTSQLFDIHELRSVLWDARELRPELAEGFAARIDTTGRAGAPLNQPHRQVVCEELGPELDAGATLCVSGLHLRCPTMAALARDAQRLTQFTGRVGVNCYLSSDGCGFGAHFDARVVTVVQLQGRKRWRYTTRVATPYPSEGARYTGDELLRTGESDGPLWVPDESDWTTVELRPGDVLCLPAGAWHAASAEGESLALNVYFEHASFLAAVEILLRQQLSHKPVWRSGPLPCRSGQEQDAGFGGALGYYRARLKEAARLLEELAEDPSFLQERYVTDLHCAELATLAPTSRSAPPWNGVDALKVNRSQPLHWCRGRSKPGEAETFTLLAGKDRLTFSVVAASAIISILERGDEPFRVPLEECDRSLIDLLISVGVLHVLSPRRSP